MAQPANAEGDDRVDVAIVELRERRLVGGGGGEQFLVGSFPHTLPLSAAAPGVHQVFAVAAKA
jgi:hypothetical protein